MTNFWIVYAILASVLWGLSYVVYEQVLGLGFTPITIMFLGSLISTIVLSIIMVNTLDINNIALTFSSYKAFGSLLFLIILDLIASYFIITSIGMHNAASASIVEISYPFFTILFTYLIFGGVIITWKFGLGAILIFSGVVIILTSS